MNPLEFNETISFDYKIAYYKVFVSGFIACKVNFFRKSANKFMLRDELYFFQAEFKANTPILCFLYKPCKMDVLNLDAMTEHFRVPKPRKTVRLWSRLLFLA